MKKCLCCNKELNETASLYELSAGWHEKCIKNFFGTKVLPELDVSEENLKQLAIENVNKGFTIPGVQKKLSLHLTKEDKPRLTLVNYPTGYILKPQTENFDCLPEAEFLVMEIAKNTGIKTVPFALLNSAGQYVYITKRIDRKKENNRLIALAMEDFCQLEERLTQDKYKGSYERCAKVINKYSSRLGFDLSEFLLRLIFSFVVGNSDMHLKNFSLIETKEGSQEYVLSDAYDLLPVNAIMPEDKEQFALTLNGKKSNIRKKDFFIFSENIGVNKTITEKMIKTVVSKENSYLTLCDQSYLSDKLKISLKEIIKERISILKN